MGRLIQEKRRATVSTPKTGSGSQSRRTSADPVESTASSTVIGEDNADGFLTKVAKLVPSEIIAGYLALIGISGSMGEAVGLWGLTHTELTILGAFAFCQILTPIYFFSQVTKRTA